jgi:hypothetical protein
MNTQSSKLTISVKKKEFLDDSKPLFNIEVIAEDSFPDFDYILIKNYYTYTINIVQFYNDKWKCILNDYKLMSDPDFDEDGEKYSLIHRKTLDDNGFIPETKVIRFYLTQDSTFWRDFTLEEIKFIKDANIQLDNIKYNSSNMRFEIGKNIILNDKEEINQKYIEIIKVDNCDISLSLFK